MFWKLSHLTDLLFPRTCAGCGLALLEQGMHVCWDCRETLSIISPPFCSCCGEPVHGRIDHAYVCHSCMKRPPAYRHARAAIHYNVIGKRLVTQFKYNHALWLETMLAELLAAGVQAHLRPDDYDVITAVPLHPVKRRERGYNQSWLLAKSLAGLLNKPICRPDSLKRTRPTPSQTRLTAGKRLTNVLGAFNVNDPRAWMGKRVLLIDDVMTTGATASACATVLREAGAEYVDVATVARGI
ncbi:MAG TPA: ComF family protein [Kiritimatiellia bacterium]|nr:ComF family protein [Kiritimatiellia bacterium]